MTPEDRISMLKQGFNERQIGDIFNEEQGNIMVGVDWCALDEHWERQYSDDYLRGNN